MRSPTRLSDNGKAVLMVRNSCDHLVGLNMDILLDNRNITGKHLGFKGLHLNKAGSTLLAKNIYKLWKFWWYLEHLNECPARVSNLQGNNVSWLSIKRTELLKTWAKQMSQRILLTVNLLVVLNLHLMINIIYVGAVLKTPQWSFGQINVNSIKNKFAYEYHKNEIDIFMISETKIDNIVSQYLAWSGKSWGWNTLLFFVKEDIPCKTITTDCDNDFEAFFVEMNFRK